MDSVYRVEGNDVIGYWYRGLSRGCRLCMKGSKIVIFVTGICGVDCYYCPISRERRSSEAFYVDEEKIHEITTIIDEASFVRAEGASITGGEPMQRYDLTIKIIQLLKDTFGQSFHMHLYTSGLGATKNAIKYLDVVGLDEIRFHIVNDSIWKLIEYAVKNTAMDVGIEIPAIPGNDEEIWRIVLRADRIGVKFINLNEMEVSETNLDRILFRGYRIAENGKTVVGSMETAKRILAKAIQNGISIPIHLCPAQFKDSIQQRARMLRKARMCANIDDKVTEDGMIIRGDEEMEPRLDVCAPLLRH
ncbi:MAG: 4Fe-4S cluster-binding domain-containing protein [Ignisphaera sp.]